jgi:hypothetical protein
MRVVSDGDLLDVSGSSTDSGPRQKSAEHVKRPPVDVHRKNKPPQRKGEIKSIFNKNKLPFLYII